MQPNPQPSPCRAPQWKASHQGLQRVARNSMNSNHIRDMRGRGGRRRAIKWRSPRKTRHYRPRSGTTGLAVLPANCRKCSLLEVRQWPGSKPVLPATRYYRSGRGTTGRRGLSSLAFEPCNLIHSPTPTYPFVAILFIGSYPLRSRSD